MNETVLLVPIDRKQICSRRNVRRIERRRNRWAALKSPRIENDVCARRIANSGRVVYTVKRICDSVATPQYKVPLICQCVRETDSRPEVVLVQTDQSLAAAARRNDLLYVREVIPESAILLSRRGGSGQQVISQAEVQSQTIVHLPVVLNEKPVLLHSQIERTSERSASLSETSAQSPNQHVCD